MEEKKTLTEKLNNIMNTFEQFQGDMEQKREWDENKIATMKEEMSKLESTINAEITKRIEMNKSIKTKLTNELDVTREELMQAIADMRKSLEEKVQFTLDRLNQIEKDYHEDRDRLMAEIAETNRRLVEQLNEFKKKFEEEQEFRRKQEAEMNERLAKHEQYVKERFEREKSEREKKISALWNTLDAHAKGRAKADLQMNRLITDDMAKLKNDLTSEIQLRENEDDEIVTAIHKYTEKLQSSLKIINSTDT